MLNLYAGRENIDKERFIYDRIRENGGGAFVLVPDQYTLVAEEQALKYLETDCLFDVEILSMSRLGLRVLTEQGRESVRMLDKYGRFMLLSRLVREHADEFEIFSRAADKLSFITMLNDFISEFKQQNCSLDELKEMLDGNENDPILEAKLKEIAEVVSAYEEAIKDRFTDSEDYISMYTNAIGESKFLRGRHVWVYGYDSITPKFADSLMELSVVAASVNFIVNRSDFDLDEQVIAYLKRIADERGIDFSCEEIPAGYRMSKSETISRIEKSLWKDVLSEDERQANVDFIPEDLTVVCAANPYYEAESAAAYVWHLIRDLGYRMRDIQIVANDESVMQPIIRRTFAEYGLPVFADTSRNITDSAAVSFIVNLLNFVKSRKLSQFLFAMLKTGLTQYDDSEIESLENYARSYRIRGSMWDKPFKYGREDVGEEAFENLEEMRHNLSEQIAPLCNFAARVKTAGDTKTVAGFTKEFRAYLEDTWQLGEKVQEAAEIQDEAGLHDEAQRMTQSFEMANKILDQIDEIMGDAEFDLSEFTDIYVAGLSDVEVGVIPPAADGLTVGTMIRTRPGPVRAAVILGANEGTLPMAPSTEGLFSMDEKDFFKENGFALGRLDDIKMDEENAAMYRMMARPTEKLYISYSMTDASSGDASPSEIIESLTELFPRIITDGLIRKDIVSEGWNISLVNNEDGAMRHLVNQIKSDSSEPLTTAALKWYSENRREELEAMLKATAYDNDPMPLSRRTAGALYCQSDGSLVTSTSAISGYIDCPFKYYVDRGLRPKEERTFASDSRSVGDVYHECLMVVARRLMDMIADEKRDRIADMTDEELFQLVESALDEISASYRGGLFISTGSEEYRMSRIREICAAAAKAMAKQLAAGTVIDAKFEEKFGRHGEFEPITLKVGNDTVYVEGRIDRADIIDVGGEKRIRIIDYKTGADRLDIARMRKGIKMQLMIYLISAVSGGMEPAGMFYFNIKDPIEAANDKSSSQLDGISNREASDEFRLKGAFIDEEGVLESMPASVLSSSKGGITREEYEEIRSDVIYRIEEAAKGILNGRIGINPLKDEQKLACNYCGYKSVCRRDRGYSRNYARTIADREGEKSPDKESKI